MELIATHDNTGRLQDDRCATFKIVHRLDTPMHYCDENHHDHLISLNVGGSVDLAWKSKGSWHKEICKSGDIIRIVPCASRVENIWLQPLNSLMLQLNRRYTDSILDTDNFMFNERYNINDPALTNLLVELNNIADVATTSHLQAVDMLYAESVCITVILHMASLYAADGKKRFASKGKLSSHQLKTIIDYTRATIRQNLTLEEMAKQVHLSPFHFARQFKRTVGTSPYRFVLQLKIEHAKMAMKKCKGSIIDIAHELNFADQAHFSNTFKKVTGISPRRYLHR
jgi:AraC family transcriptional regulator